MSHRRNNLEVGLLGLGTVGSEVAKRLQRDDLADTVRLRAVLVRDPSKARPGVARPDLLTTDVGQILEDPGIEVVIEVAGGEYPALDWIRRALGAGKHVITANKLLIARHGAELHRLAEARGRHLLYEAAVGGGLPILSLLRDSLNANQVSEIVGIINGTTNFVLGMLEQGQELNQAVSEAQRLGYAEADPTLDLNGQDAAFKLSIIASIAFGRWVDPANIACQGITKVTLMDITCAKQLGYMIKMTAVGRASQSGLDLRVHPSLVARQSWMAGISGADNGVCFETDMIGPVILTGQGAGGHSTASAVVSDLLRVVCGQVPNSWPHDREPIDLAPLSADDRELAKWYLRLADRQGVRLDEGLESVLEPLGASVLDRTQVEPQGRGEEAVRAYLIGGLSAQDVGLVGQRLDARLGTEGSTSTFRVL